MALSQPTAKFIIAPETPKLSVEPPANLKEISRSDIALFLQKKEAEIESTVNCKASPEHTTWWEDTNDEGYSVHKVHCHTCKKVIRVINPLKSEEDRKLVDRLNSVSNALSALEYGPTHPWTRFFQTLGKKCPECGIEDSIVTLTNGTYRAPKKELCLNCVGR